MNVALRSAALRLKTKAEATLAQDRLANTARRANMAAEIARRAQREAARADVALRIADGEGDLLRRVNTIRAIETLELALETGRYHAAARMGTVHERISDEDAIAYARWPANDEAAKRLRGAQITDYVQLRAALRELCALRGEPIREDPVKVLERKLVGATIPGYFPTPRHVAARMAELAGVRRGSIVLEPSAGCGRLAEAAREAGCDEILCIEVNLTLFQLLEAKGFTSIHDDFMDEEYDHQQLFDGGATVVLTNPPFERGQDMDHVRRAFAQLRPGGTLVAIMSQGPFFREDAKSRGFRAWLETVNVDHREDLPPGTFDHSDVTQRTNVSAKLIRIRAPR